MPWQCLQGSRCCAQIIGERARLFPGAKMAPAPWFAPVHDVGEPKLCPAARGTRTSAGNTLQPVGTVIVSSVAEVNQLATSSMLSQ